ncbi:Acyl-coenzyme A thioesterase 11 [Actinomortierella ambigua]|nr:Acyl-coenzyme A thioesterase 11 [Actinomortierella ambigua]
MDAIRSLVRSWKHPRSRQHSASSAGSGASGAREELVEAEAEAEDSQQQQQEGGDPTAVVWQPELPLSKFPSESWVTMTELVLPQHCDPRGYCLGGTLLAWIDVAAGIAAKKHGVYPAVTRSVDAVHFLAPITTHNIVILQASVNRAWKTSMEIGVRIVIEDIFSVEQRYCCHAYLTFVALPQPPLALPAASTAQSPQLSRRTSRAETYKIIMANSPAGRRYSTSSLRGNHLETSSSSAPTSSAPTPSVLSPPSKVSIQLPAIQPQTPIEHARFNLAQLRREARLRQSRESKAEETKLMSELRAKMRSWSITSQAQHFGGSMQTIQGLVSPGVPPDQQRPRVPMQATYAESTQLVLPQHANSLSITFGGQVMKWMENTCAVAASRFLRRPIVTASIDSLQFHTPSNVGDTLTFRAVITRAFHTSVEVYCFVDGENLLSGQKTFTNEAFFSMVAVMPALPSSSPATANDATTISEETPLVLPPTVALVPMRVAKPAPSYQPPILVPSSHVEQALSDGADKRRAHRLAQRQQLKEYETKLHAQQTEEMTTANSPRGSVEYFPATIPAPAIIPTAAQDVHAAETTTDIETKPLPSPHAHFAE